MSGHWTSPVIDHDTVAWNFECREPIGAMCRLECALSCGAESYPCHGWVHGAPAEISEDDEDWAHPLVDSGSCNALDWLDDLREEAHVRETEPIRDGEITIEWDGDGYTWRYRAEAAA